MNDLEKRVLELEARLNYLEKSDRYTIQKNMEFNNGRNIQLAKGVGTKIGTETTQKLGFFGHAPASQQTASASAGSILTILQAYGLSG